MIPGMSVDAAVAERLERAFGLYTDLLATLSPVTLSARLGELPSNAIGAQLWCVVGARESYARAIEAGRWSGFTCSLSDTHDVAAVADALARSSAAVRAALDSAGADDEAGRGFALDLLEHEAAHQGQLIRYLYGLRLPIPASWKARWALE